MWYIQRRGRTEGPVPDETIAHAIQKGELGPYDLIFREGESRWQVLSEVARFSSLFQKKRPEPPEEDMWVLLVREGKNKNRKQKGPFTTDQLKQLLKVGKVSLNDYAWKEGMKEWYRLHSLPALQEETSPDAPEVPPVPPVRAKREELLKNVRIQEKKRKATPPEPLPPEADGIDLTKTYTEITRTTTQVTQVTQSTQTSPKKTHRKRSRKRIEADDFSQITQVRTLSIWDRLVDTLYDTAKRFYLSRRATTRFAMAGVVALFLLGILYTLTFTDIRVLAKKKQKSRGRDQIEVVQHSQDPISKAKSELKNELKPTKMKGDSQGVQAQTAPAPRQSPLPTEAPVVAPTYLQLKTAQANTQQAKLEIQTNASRHFTVRLRIVGVTGRVIGHKSYYRTRRVRFEDRSLPVEKLNLPYGDFVVYAEVGDFEDQVALRWGGFAKDFHQQMARHRKSISYFALSERYELIQAGTYFTDLANQLASFLSMERRRFQGEYKKWRRALLRSPSPTFKSISPNKRTQFVYANEWFELKDSHQQLKTTAESLAKSKEPATAPAAAELRRIIKELERQKEAALQASLWR